MFQIYDFQLSEDEMESLKKLDRGEKARVFQFKTLKG